jgi:PAS domain S-box-containing protein
MFGLPPDTLMNYSVFEAALHPEDRSATSEATRASLEHGKSYDITYRTVWPDGSIHWLRSKGEPQVTAAGETKGLRGIVIDRDEQEQTREALRASERRYTALFRNKLNGIAHCRSIYNDAGAPVDYEVLEVNQAYETITGLKKADVEHRMARALFPGIENCEVDFIGLYGKIAKEGGESSFEAWFAPLNQWQSIYVYSPVPGEFGCIFSDISPRREAERALQRSEERLRLAQSAAGVGVWEWHPKERNISFTPELCCLYGLKEGASHTDADWYRCVHPEDVARIEALRERLVMEGGALDIEFRIRKGDETRWIHEKGSAFKNPDGIGVRVLGVALDISDRKQLEGDLRQLNENLESRVASRTGELATANRELEAFTYSVSHDLRTPLRGIDGFARILLTDFAPALQPAAVRYLNLVRENTRRMGQLIDDLLSFSRVSRQALHKESIDPVAIVSEVWEELHAERAGRAIDFSVLHLPVCQAEPTMLKQVWLNLLSNAVKFTSKKEVASIKVGYDNAAYYVEDNGAGFDMRYADKLFGIFQRLHHVEDYEGTGVGLAIVARIVRRHGGEVRADGIPDHGATVSFTL